MSTVFADRTAARPIIESLFSRDVFSKDGENVLSDDEMTATALFVVNLFLGAGSALGVLRALNKKAFKEFDANPGDGGCQLRALALREIASLDLEAECGVLGDTLQNIKKAVTLRKSNPRAQSTPASDFFSKQFKEIEVSQELEFLMHCHLLKVLRSPYQTLPNGVVLTKSEMARLSVFSQKMDRVDHSFRFSIVEESQQKTSLFSMERIRKEAAMIKILPEYELDVLNRMLSKENTHLYTPDVRFLPKAFGCLFFGVKTLLFRLREEETLICLKAIVPAGKDSFRIFLRPAAKGADFSLVPEDAVAALDSSESVIVFEMVFSKNKANTLELLAACSFTEAVLCNASMDIPFERTSKVEDITDPKGLEEVMGFRDKAKERSPFFSIDHIFFNTLGFERKV